MSAQPEEVLGIGAGSMDLYRPFGQVTEHLYIEGEKGAWADSDEQLLQRHQAGEDMGLTEEVGGNMPNVLAYLALKGHKTTFLSVLAPEGEPVSDKVRGRLAQLGIEDASHAVEGHITSVGMVERLQPGSDRMIRGKARGPMLEHMSPAFIRAAAGSILHFVVASTKNPYLNRRFFENTPDGSFRDFNPGSAEYLMEEQYESSATTHHLSLKATMSDHPVTLLSTNGDEMKQMWWRLPNADPRDLAEHTVNTGLAKNVLCTLGKHGMYLVSAHGTSFYQPEMLDPLEVIDTLGAGDRANAVAMEGLMRGKPAHQILEHIAEETAHVIRTVGGHADVLERRKSGLVMPDRSTR